MFVSSGVVAAVGVFAGVVAGVVAALPAVAVSWAGVVCWLAGVVAVSLSAVGVLLEPLTVC